jgi:surfeit locus 1 family protein
MAPRVFAPRLVPTLVALPLLVVLVWLGHWQMDRADETRAREVAFAASVAPPVPLPPDGALAPRYLHVRVPGLYLTERQFLLDNMTAGGRVGYRVLTPFVTAPGSTVLIDRGWIPLGASRDARPDLAVGGEPRVLTGRLDALPRAGIDPPPGAGSGWPRVLNYPSLATLSAALGRPLYHSIVLLDAGAADGYLRDWQPHGVSVERHVAYAAQWYALAATLLGLYVIAAIRRRGPA